MRLLKRIKYPLISIVLLTTIILLVYTKRLLNKSKYEEVVIPNNLEEVNIVEEKAEKEENCTVDIKGAVKNPGVYYITCKSNISDVINAAGGLNKDADTSITNLAKRINDEMVIIIYTKEEIKNSNIVDTVVKVVEKECICPNIQNDGCINNEITSNIGNNDNTTLININTATKEILQTLPGIGESKAKAIIQYREEHGNFSNIEELKNVEGIGDKLYEDIKIYITT